MPQITLQDKLNEAKENLAWIKEQIRNRDRQGPGAFLMERNLQNLLRVYEEEVEQLTRQIRDESPGYSVM